MSEHLLNTIDLTDIRTTQIEGMTFYHVIDVIASLRKIDHKLATNYYHVVKGRLSKRRVVFPNIERIKAKSNDGKFYYTEFMNIENLKIFLGHIENSIKLLEERGGIRKSDEVKNFHPKVMAYLQNLGFNIQHHAYLPSGKQIDFVAQRHWEILIIECKPSLKKDFYKAVGQILCYWSEYIFHATPTIATYSDQVDEYIEKQCLALKIQLLLIPRNK